MTNAQADTTQTTAAGEIGPPPGPHTPIAAYRLSPDDHSWAIQKRRTRKGKETWDSVAWYPTPELAAQRLFDRLLREGSPVRPSNEELIETIRQARDEIARTMREIER